jgi:2'-hydroxyisoflavone reductase
MTMGEMLDGMRSAIGASTEFTWVPGAFLQESGVPPVSLMPWVSQVGPYSGLARLSPVRCFANGMAFRPFADTVRDTLAWWKEQPEERRTAMRGGLRGGSLAAGPVSMDQQMAREAEILAAWKARKPA